MLERDDRDGNVNWRFLCAPLSLVVSVASPRLNEITAPPREKCGWKLWRGRERLAPRSASSFIFGTCHICMEYKPELEMVPFAAVCCTAGSHLRKETRSCVSVFIWPLFLQLLVLRGPNLTSRRI